MWRAFARTFEQQSCTGRGRFGENADVVLIDGFVECDYGGEPAGDDVWVGDGELLCSQLVRTGMLTCVLMRLEI